MFLDLSERYGVFRDMSDDRGIHDLLSTPAHTPEALQLQIQMQIRDSLSAINRDTRDTRKDLLDVRERVIRLEERDRRLDTVEAAQTALHAKVEILIREKDERAGAQGAVVGVRGWIPIVIAILAALSSLFTGIYLAGRSAGVISAPPSQGSHPFASERTEVGAGKP